jgi:hypothetical protein
MAWTQDQIRYVMDRVDSRQRNGFASDEAFAQFVWDSWNQDPLTAERELKMTLELRRWFRRDVIATANPTHHGHWTTQEILEREG